MKLYLTGKVIDGSIKITQKDKYYKEVLEQEFNNKEIIIEISHVKKTRSDEQNKLYWSQYVLAFSNEWKVTAEQAHEILKREFNPTLVDIKGKKYKVGNSTTGLSKSQFGEYLNRIAEYANANGIIL